MACKAEKKLGLSLDDPNQNTTPRPRDALPLCHHPASDSTTFEWLSTSQLHILHTQEVPLQNIPVELGSVYRSYGGGIRKENEGA